MSVQSPVSVDSQATLLQRIWVDCFRSVLGQVAGFPITVEPETDEEFAVGEASDDKTGVWALFTASKALHGEMAILSTEAGALPLAQILMSEPPDPAVPFDQGRRDAYEEFLRQVAGQVATTLKSAARGEVEITHSGADDAPSWPDASRMGIRIAGEKIPSMRLVLVVTADLVGSFPPPQEAKPPEAAKAERATMPQPEPSAARSSNLELLLDVALDATIRFGQKQMLLRDILELHPGVAIALDRQVEEPVELLIGGRMVARGEVVIVDGNYGLRITEIVSPQQRLESLRG
jgi:flagellar motor switch protein FliN/FliY